MKQFYVLTTFQKLFDEDLVVSLMISKIKVNIFWWNSLFIALRYFDFNYF